MPIVFFPVFLVLEILLSIALISELGFVGTLMWLVAALMLGLNLLRVQGPASMMRAAQEMRSGGQPGEALADGLCKSLAAVLLILPGIVSDLLALLLLVKPLRRLLFNRVLGRLMANTQFQARGFGASHNPFQSSDNPFQSSDNPFQRGNVYEHQGSGQPPAASPGDAIEGELLPAPEDKPRPPNKPGQ